MKEKKSHSLAGIITSTVCLVAALVLVLVSFGELTVTTSGMSPTIEIGDKVRVLKYTIFLPTIKHRDIAVGDIVCYVNPDLSADSITDGPMYLARVIGVGGDTVSVQGGIVSVNSEVLEESYVEGSASWGTPEFKVPHGVYFLLGDDRTVYENSNFNKEFNLVSLGDIKGVVLKIVKPQQKGT